MGGVCRPVDFLVREGGNCLWWKVRPVRGEKAEGWVAWRGGVQASDRGKFGTEWRSVVKAISGEVVLGCS